MGNPVVGSLGGETEEGLDWERVSPRHIKPERWQQYERWVAEILSEMGMRLDTPGTADTPRRFLRSQACGPI